MDETLSYLVGEPLRNSNYKHLWQKLKETVSKHPESIALVSSHQKYDLLSDPKILCEEKCLRWTFRDLHNVVERCANGLVAHGITTGMPIFTFVPNCAEYIIILWASHLLGCTFVPLSIQNLKNEREIAHMIETALMGCKLKSGAAVAADQGVASQLDSYAALDGYLKIVLSSSEFDRWEPFDSLLSNKQHITIEPTIAHEYLDSSIFFTSGTTSAAKGCHWRYPGLTFYLESVRASGAAYSLRHGDVCATTMPNSHVLGYMFIVEALCHGGTVLFPGVAFDPHSFLSIARTEGCTHMVAVPTMVYALAEEARGRKLDSLKSVILGGATITPEVLRVCTETLGADGVDISYGNTEGVYLVTGMRRPEEVLKDSSVSVGWCLNGMRLKLCDPATSKVVSKGEPGELHISARSVIDGYIGKTSSDFYDDDDGHHWCKTGDQGVLDTDGRVYITGRYTDMIIRGGENISPLAVESIIKYEHPDLENLELQVVGADDEYAGEVPVAVVVEPVDCVTVNKIKGAVVKSMGPRFAIDDVISIQQLDIQQYPATSIGKAQKKALKELVNRYRKRISNDTPISFRLSDKVMQILTQALGVEMDDTTMQHNISDMGDSITLANIRNMILKQTGINMHAKEMFEAGTPANLVDLVEARSEVNTEHDGFRRLIRKQPPVAEDLAYVVEGFDTFETTKDVVQQCLAQHGSYWTDVRDITPAYDFTHIGIRAGTFHRRTIEITALVKNIKVETLRVALRKAVANNPLLTSFVVWDDDRLGTDLTLHVTVDQSDRYLDSLITYHGTLSSKDELEAEAKKLSMQPPQPYPGPLFRARLYDIEDIKGAGFIWTFNHATGDMISSSLFIADLDLALGGATELRSHVPYKLWCDSFYNHRKSPAARIATNYHVRNLENLHHHKGHTWPPMEIPKPTEFGGTKDYIHAFPAKTIQDLCKEHRHLAPSVVVKAAHALFLQYRTKHTHAIFTHIEGARDRFPFLPTSMIDAGNLYANDVAGQLMQYIVNLVEIRPEEKTLDFLTRLQEEQVMQTRYSAAPWREIMDGLDGASAALFPSIARSFIYNWGAEANEPALANLELAGTFKKGDNAAFRNHADLVRDKADGDRISFNLLGFAFDDVEKREIACQLEAATLWLADPRNRERPIRESSSAFSTWQVNGYHEVAGSETEE